MIIKNYTAGLRNTPLHSVFQVPDFAGAIDIAAKADPVGSIHVKLIGENERHHHYRIQELESIPSHQDRIYAGIGGFINLSYIAASKARAGLLLDINPLQIAYWNRLIPLLSRHGTAAEFRNALIERQPAINDDLWALGKHSLEHNGRDFTRGGRKFFINLEEKDFIAWVECTSETRPEGLWMHHDEFYSHLHEMARENALGAACLDLQNHAACMDFRAFLKNSARRCGLPSKQKVGFFYISNLLAFLSPDRETDFIGRRTGPKAQNETQANLGILLNEDSIVVECDNWFHGRPLLLSAASYRKMAGKSPAVPPAPGGP